MFFVEWPDVDRAKQVDEEFKFLNREKLGKLSLSESDLTVLSMCKDTAEELADTMHLLKYLHIVLTFVNVYKEIFEKQYLRIGILFKVLLISMTFAYFYLIVDISKLFV